MNWILNDTVQQKENAFVCKKPVRGEAALCHLFSVAGFRLTKTYSIIGRAVVMEMVAGPKVRTSAIASAAVAAMAILLAGSAGHAKAQDQTTPRSGKASTHSGGADPVIVAARQATVAFTESLPNYVVPCALQEALDDKLRS
jgi:hypothetical protein